MANTFTTELYIVLWLFSSIYIILQRYVDIILHRYIADHVIPSQPGPLKAILWSMPNGLNIDMQTSITL